MLVNPSNFYFKIVYQDEDQTEPDAIFSNTGNMTIDEMKKLGRYCYLTSDSIFIETNLSEIPQNITVSMENNNLYDADSYYIIAESTRPTPPRMSMPIKQTSTSCFAVTS